MRVDVACIVVVTRNIHVGMTKMLHFLLVVSLANLHLHIRLWVDGRGVWSKMHHQSVYLPDFFSVSNTPTDSKLIIHLPRRRL